MSITEDQYKKAASDLGVSVAAIKAVAEVESNGSGFIASTGQPKILFERHIMYKQLVKNGLQSVADEALKTHPTVVNKTAGGYKGGVNEWLRLDEAVDLDRKSALESCSWGAFQIMGFYWKTLGYSSIQDLVNAAYSGDAGQLDMFVRFIKANPGIVKAMKNLDWASVAKQYNGVNYAKNKYDVKLRDAYKKYS